MDARLQRNGLRATDWLVSGYRTLARAMGASEDSVVLAVEDAVVGEFERLKAFGIRARRVGDDVVFQCQGSATTIPMAQDTIEDAIAGIGHGLRGGLT